MSGHECVTMTPAEGVRWVRCVRAPVCVCLGATCDTKRYAQGRQQCSPEPQRLDASHNQWCLTTAATRNRAKPLPTRSDVCICDSLGSGGLWACVNVCVRICAYECVRTDKALGVSALLTHYMRVESTLLYLPGELCELCRASCTSEYTY